QDAKAEDAGPDLIAPLFRPGLGEPNTADFGIAIRAAGHLVVVERPELLAGNPFGERDALGRRQVRELRGAWPTAREHIANARDSWQIRAEGLVDVDVSPLEPEACLFGAQPGCHWPAAGRHEEVLAVDLLGPSVRGARLYRHGWSAGLRARHRRAGQHAD